MSYEISDCLQKDFQAGWHDLVHLFFNQYLASNGTDQGIANLRNIGKSLAQLHPIGGSKTVDELEGNLNAKLSYFNWGFVRIAPAQTELILAHCAWPHAPKRNDEPKWRLASACILEGAYSQWLVSQGGDGKLPVIWEERNTQDVLLFRYANQG